MDTNHSLLFALKDEDDQQAWQLLNELYAPLIKRWLMRCDIRVNDVDDVLQEVFIQVMKKIDSFECSQRKGSFRNWLKRVTVNCFRNYAKKRGNQALAVGGSDFHVFVEQCENPLSEESRAWDAEHQQSVLRYLMNKVKPKFQPATWEAFYETAVKNRPAADVANELSLSVGALHTAKSRVLAEMRRIGIGLLNDDFELPVSD